MYRPPPSQEVDVHKLIPGTMYRSLPLRGNTGLEEMRGIFVEYFTNSIGYSMVRFRPAYVRMGHGDFHEYPPFNREGFISRVWTPPISQMRNFYKVSKFTAAEVGEIRRRVRARERREAQRGLMGSFPEGRIVGSWPREKLPAVILGLIAKCL